MKNKKMYKKLTELNKPYSRSSGQILCMDKANTKKNDSFASHIQIRDCHSTIYLHSYKNIHHSKKAKESYIWKIETLISALEDYLEHIKKVKVKNK
jgi:hypothetical protein